MILVKLNEADFEYDIYSLVKAFYPDEELAVSRDMEDLLRKKENVEKRFQRKEEVSLYFDIKYEIGEFNLEAYQVKDIEIYEEDEIETGLTSDISFEAEKSMTLIASKSEDDYKESLEDRELLKIETPDPEQRDRKALKNKIKRMLYDLLTEITKKELPWGTLTGIRPTKIPMKLLEDNRERVPELKKDPGLNANPVVLMDYIKKRDEEESKIRRYLNDTYYVSAPKASTAYRIAEKEYELLNEFDYKSGYSLYIGIPFCPTKCLYCSFTSYPIASWQNIVADYLKALKKEISYVSDAMKDKPLQTIYMGGGTPTTLNGNDFHDLLSFIEDKFDLSNLREFTIEGGRPDSISRDNLGAIRLHPIVDRISINPQTMNQKTLDLIGRRHTTEQIKESFALARDLGFDNINMDMILGLPEEGKTEVLHTLEEIESLGPDSLTVHALAVKRAARLRTEQKNYEKYTMQNSQELMQLVREYATIMGMDFYYLYRQKNMAGNLENVGYSTKGKECLYNILIMEEKQTIVSVGAGGLTKVVDGDNRTRIENVKDVENYIARVDEMIERKREVLG